MGLKSIMDWMTGDGDEKQSDKLSYTGGGKVSVPISSIINSPKVQRQVDGVREIAESDRDGAPN
jgi:hypothetical protein